MRQVAGKIAVYSRKSKFTGKGESIGNQVEMCREYIRNLFGEGEPGQVEVFEDEGFSGGNLMRPAFRRMMEGVRKREFQAIVVYRLDRISRNINDFAGLIEELSKLDVSFISIREQFDTSTPMGRAMMFIISVFSQLERETIAERIRDNMLELAKTGRWLGGNTPTGYTSEGVTTVTIDGRSKKAYRLKLVSEEAETVKSIFDLYTQTDSLTAVEAELLARRIKSKNGKDHTRFSIKTILQNPVYMMADGEAWQYFVNRKVEIYSNREAFDGVRGIMAYNRTEQEKGRSTVYLPMEEWIVAVGAHPGLIPSRQWIRVQDSLERNKSKGYRKPRSNEALLTGLIYCTCGERMYPKLTKRMTPAGEPAYSYVCRMKERSKGERCSRRNAQGNLLDAAVISEMKKLTENDRIFVSQMENCRRFYTGNRDQYESQLTGLKSEYAENEKKIDGLIDSLAMVGASFARERIVQRLEQLQKCNREIENRIRELEGLTNANTMNDLEFDMLRQMLAVLRSSMDVINLEEKRAAVRTVVRKVTWDGLHAHVVLFGAEGETIESPDMSSGMTASAAEADKRDSSSVTLHEGFRENSFENPSGESTCAFVPLGGEGSE